MEIATRVEDLYGGGSPETPIEKPHGRILLRHREISSGGLSFQRMTNLTDVLYMERE